MSQALAPIPFLEHEARALLSRLALLRSFAYSMPMLPAAAPTPGAMRAIEQFLALRKAELRDSVRGFLEWIRGPIARVAPPEKAQRKFTLLKIRFNSVISQFDLFADILAQRAEHGTGTWVAGLDKVALDVLAIPGMRKVEIACYVDRGAGASIRRARARLWGGSRNPIAVVRLPRERMIGGCGIASSLAHEVGHQAADLLDLVPSLRTVLGGLASTRKSASLAWRAFQLWLPEIISDFWSAARIGVASTLGLISVVSLPRPIVFRPNFDDVHPMPWLRVHISSVLGRTLYPDAQWDRISSLWRAFYPIDGLPGALQKVIHEILDAIPGLAAVIVNHRPRALKGLTLREAVQVDARRPERLRALFSHVRSGDSSWLSLPPSLALAAIGQGRADGRIGAADEAATVQRLLTAWATINPDPATRREVSLAIA